MNALIRGSRLGIERGLIETKQFFGNMQEIIWTIVMAGIFIGVLWFQRETKIEGISLALLTLPSLLGLTIAQAGFSGVAGFISFDREDGTLLRAKAIPQGMIGYIVSRLVYMIVTTIFSLIVVFVPAMFFIDGLTAVGLNGIVTIVWLSLLGFLATAPYGAIIGSLVKSSGSGFGLTFLPLAGLVAISGIFYPITALAGWIQFIAQLFPLYWLGHGFRSVFMPDMAVAELQGSWQLGATAFVLLVWAIVGMLIAPRVLRRMARKESGAAMQERRNQVMQRGY